MSIRQPYTRVSVVKSWFWCLVLGAALCGCGKKAEGNAGETNLDELNRALAVMSMGASRPLESVNDLTNFPTLRGKALPKAPPGKKLAIDRSQQKVVFVDE